MITGISGRDEARARGRDLRSRSGDIQANAGSRLQLRLSDAEQLASELCVGLTSVEIGIGAHRSHVRRAGNSRRLFGGRFGVGARRTRCGLRGPHATDSAEVEQILLHSAANVERIDGPLDLSLGIEDRFLACWGGEIA
jgi:hypothetical protein